MFVCLFNLFDSIAQLVKLLSCLRHRHTRTLLCSGVEEKFSVVEKREEMGCTVKLPFSEGKT